ncbi:hypothetical protein C8R47DRAFT_1209156 [Mycena vitilis]|nr:hypothetical protein C8R47DRAFT_1209156 [Mycena vitilis]
MSMPQPEMRNEQDGAGQRRDDVPKREPTTESLYSTEEATRISDASLNVPNTYPESARSETLDVDYPAAQTHENRGWPEGNAFNGSTIAPSQLALGHSTTGITDNYTPLNNMTAAEASFIASGNTDSVLDFLSEDFLNIGGVGTNFATGRSGMGESAMDTDEGSGYERTELAPFDPYRGLGYGTAGFEPLTPSAGLLAAAETVAVDAEKAERMRRFEREIAEIFEWVTLY